MTNTSKLFDLTNASEREEFIRLIWLRSGGWCEDPKHGNNPKRAQQLHHETYRFDFLTALEDVEHLCRACHSWRVYKMGRGILPGQQPLAVMNTDDAVAAPIEVLNPWRMH